DLDQLPVGEEAEGLGGAEQAAPVEMLAGDGVHLALAAAGGPCRRPDRVAGLLEEQRLVAPDGVDRREAALQLRVEGVAADLHRGPRAPAPRRAGATPGRRCRPASPGRGRPPPAPWPAPRSRCR